MFFTCSLTGERDGYYADFGGTGQLAKIFEQGYVYTGGYSHFRKCNHGSPAGQTSARQFVVYAQNHDQIGNRVMGERLSQLVGFEKLKLAAGTVLLSPFLPLLFMGEEYGETAPFQYFVNHGDPELMEAVRRGRRQEFAAFDWRDEMPDPGDLETLGQCRLNPGVCLDGGEQAVLREFYKELIRLRKGVPAIAKAEKCSTRAIPYEAQKALAVFYDSSESDVCVLLNFGEEAARLALEFPPGNWSKLLDSSERRWKGPGNTVPETITSSGRTALQMSATAVVLLQAGE